MHAAMGPSLDRQANPGRSGGSSVRVFVAGSALLIAILLPAHAAAQGTTTAAMSGHVAEVNGNSVDGARIELRDLRTGATVATITGADGRFYLPNLRPGGPYTLAATRLGFASVTREGLRLTLGQLFRVDLVLREEAVPLPELEVAVESDPDFNPSRMGAATLIDEATVGRFPSISRNFVEFAKLSPLVKLSDDGVSVAGANLRFNNLQVDGALSQDVFGLSPSGVVGGRANARVIPLEAIEQFQVLVAPYDVRQSGFTGGLLNAVTRSGTNEWSGAGFGFFRDEALVGDLEVDGVPRDPQDLNNIYVGGNLGGPVVRDRVHVFMAGEWERRRQPPAGFHVGLDDPLRTQLAPDSVTRLEGILSGFGADPGATGVYTVENTLANVFARVDAQFADGQKGLLRYSYSRASDDPPANRLPGDAYEFASTGSIVETTSHSIVGQLLSELGGGLSNDLLVNLQFIQDDELPASDYSRVEVEVKGDVEGRLLSRRVRAGAALFAHANALSQDILEITDNLTWDLGAHRVLFGGSVKRFGIRRLFLPGALGAYRFGSLADFDANAPAQYDINVPLGPGGGVGSIEDAAVDFSVLEWSAYVQDEWAVSDRLNVRLGVRIDVPVIPGEPTFNSAVEEDFGIRTDRMPSGNPIYSPRLGFNLKLSEGGGTQVRGGAGLFAGRPPFAWLANAYQNTGLESRFLTCVGDDAPAFDPTRPPPLACAGDSEPALGSPTITLFDPAFRFPQDFRASLSIDQRLPAGFVATVEGVFTKAVHQIFLEDINLGAPIPDEDRVHENGYSNGFGYGNRDAFGTPTSEGFLPGHVSDRFGQVIRVANSNDNFAYMLSAEVRRRFATQFSFLAGYSYGRSADTQTLLSLDATSNFGLNPIEGNPNVPKRQPSLFDRPHKVVLSGTLRFLERLGGTELTVLYVGQSGAPYSYVYLGDVNGDGYPGSGRTLDMTNDLLFVQEGAFEDPLGGIGALLFEQLVAQEPCLARSRVRVLSRNACRAPWSNQLDLRVTQSLRLGSASAQLFVDLLNVLNLLDGDWGHVRIVDPTVQILRLDGRAARGQEQAPPEPEDPLVVRYIGPIERTPGGGVRAAVPSTFQIPASQWQAQIGIRLSF